MKKFQKDRKVNMAPQAQAAERRNPSFGVFLVCFFIIAAILVTATLLGDRLNRFVATDVDATDANVIALVPTEDATVSPGGQAKVGATRYSVSISDSGQDDRTAVAANGGQNQNTEAGNKVETTQPADNDQNETASSVQTVQGAVSDQSQTSQGIMTAQGTETEDRTGKLGVDSDNGEGTISWTSATDIDLFKNSYTGNGGTDTVASNQKVIAPGTSNFYKFTVKNNSDLPLEYKISLDAKSFLGKITEAEEIPLEWRLLKDEGTNETVLSDWKDGGVFSQGNSDLDRKEMTTGKLESNQQEKYIIQWRWAFEHGDDYNDTVLGKAAENNEIKAEATIIIYAEGEDPKPDNPPKDPDDPDNPDKPGVDPGNDQPGNQPGNDQPGNQPGTQEPEEELPWWQPQTGDNANIILYAVLMAAAAIGLLALLFGYRRKKKDEDEQDDGR